MERRSKGAQRSFCRRRKQSGADFATTTGRPIAGESKKDAQISFRVTRQTVEKFEDCQKLSGKRKVELFEELVDSLYDRLTQEK